jgi:hypothetical protein
VVFSAGGDGVRKSFESEARGNERERIGFRNANLINLLTWRNHWVAGHEEYDFGRARVCVGVCIDTGSRADFRPFRCHWGRWRAARPDLGERWSSSSWLVATASENNLNFGATLNTSFAAASDCRTIATYEYNVLDQVEPLLTRLTVAGDDGLPVAVLTPRSFNVRAAARCDKPTSSTKTERFSVRLTALDVLAGERSLPLPGVLSLEHRLHGARDIRLAASGDVAARAASSADILRNDMP